MLSGLGRGSLCLTRRVSVPGFYVPEWDGVWSLVRSNEGVALVSHDEESVDLKNNWSVYVPTLTCGHDVWIMT